MFAVFDENKSWYLDHNIGRYCDRTKVSKGDPDFYKSNVMHSKFYHNLSEDNSSWSFRKTTNILSMSSQRLTVTCLREGNLSASATARLQHGTCRASEHRTTSRRLRSTAIHLSWMGGTRTIWASTLWLEKPSLWTWPTLVSQFTIPLFMSLLNILNVCLTLLCLQPRV